MRLDGRLDLVSLAGLQVLLLVRGEPHQHIAVRCYHSVKVRGAELAARNALVKRSPNLDVRQGKLWIANTLNRLWLTVKYSLLESPIN